MFWVDQIIDDIVKAFPDKRAFIIRDEKTLSGRVHIGSLRGIVIHGVIAQALREKGYTARYIFELNDADPMDGMPVYLDAGKFEKQMGKPLKDVPSPEDDGTSSENGYKNLADYFGQEIKAVIEKLGFHEGKEIEYVLASDLYARGIYNEWIDKVLQYPDKIRQIYKEVSGSEKHEEWNPLQIVCEKCGKVGTTTVVAWDGKEVEYTCEPHKVEWAFGCGYHGKTAPYNGRGKLPWKVEWAVKWQGNNVDIEGSGKDHNAAGGSHDVAVRIAKEVLSGHVPFNIPYEFFLFGGAKMSSSKGLGASAKEVSGILPPELLRFLMVRTWPNHPIDFDPSGDTIPRLYDRHDEAAEAYFGRSNLENAIDLKRAFYFSQLDSKNIPDRYFPRFSRVAFILQIPSLNLLEAVGKLKGSKLTVADKGETEERREYAKIWLEKYASDQAKFTIQDKIPSKAKELTNDQKAFLHDIADLLSQKNWEGEELHAAIHDLRKKSPMDARTAFQSIYIVLLGKDSGPQAGWFLEALDKKFVITRFREC